MLKWLKGRLEQGFQLPAAWNGKVPASERLLFSHLSFYLAFTCVALNAEQAWTAIAFFGLCTVLHMFKEVDKLKFSGSERSLEISDEPEASQNEQEVK